MSKIYEDEFMELQAGLISLCLELVSNNVDKVYVYGSIEEKSFSFNAFFEKDRKIKTTNELVANQNAIWEFLDLGISDLKELKNICNRYKQPVPTELKLVYNNKTGKLDTKYKYKTICSAKTGIDSSEIFLDWMNEMEQSVVDKSDLP